MFVNIFRELFPGETYVRVGVAGCAVDNFSEPSALGVGRSGLPLMLGRPRVVPLRTIGPSYRSTPLGETLSCVHQFFGIMFAMFSNLFTYFRCCLQVLPTPIMERHDILRNRCKRRLIRSDRAGRKKGLFYIYVCISFLVSTYFRSFVFSVFFLHVCYSLS